MNTIYILKKLVVQISVKRRFIAFCGWYENVWIWDATNNVIEVVCESLGVVIAVEDNFSDWIAVLEGEDTDPGLS